MNLYQALNQLVLVFWSICRLKVGPEVLPRNDLLLGITVSLAILVQVLSSNSVQINLGGLAEASPVQSRTLIELLGFSLSIVLEALFVWGILRMLNLQSRAYKTFFALVGTGLVFQTMLLVVVLATQNSLGDSGSALALVFVFSTLALTAWFLLVGGHVFRRALESTLLRGVLLFLGLGVLQLLTTIATLRIFGLNLQTMVA